MFRLMLIGKTAYVADTYAMIIMSLTMSANHMFWPTFMNRAITINDIVVTNGREPSRPVPLFNVGNGVVLTLQGSTTMND